MPRSLSGSNYAYDLTDRRLSMTDGAGTTVYAYDPIGRLIETLRAGRTVSYDYDPAGRISEVEYPSSIGTVSYDYDPEGRLEQITDWDERTTTFGYNALDRVETITRPDDLVTSFTYDALSRVTQVEHAHDGTPEITMGYTYDAVGNVETRTDDLGTATFGYDDLDRLTGADYPGANDHAWTHDAVGNLLSITDPGGTTNHTYDDADPDRRRGVHLRRQWHPAHRRRAPVAIAVIPHSGHTGTPLSGDSQLTAWPVA